MWKKEEGRSWRRGVRGPGKRNEERNVRRKRGVVQGVGAGMKCKGKRRKVGGKMKGKERMQKEEER